MAIFFREKVSLCAAQLASVGYGTKETNEGHIQGGLVAGTALFVAYGIVTIARASLGWTCIVAATTFCGVQAAHTFAHNETIVKDSIEGSIQGVCRNLFAFFNRAAPVPPQVPVVLGEENG